MRNRTRILLLTLVTLLLTAAAVVAANEWYRRPTVVTIAVGPEASPESRFAARLAEVLHQNHSSVRLKVVNWETRAQAVLSFAHRGTDLAVIRSDDTRIPANARALAVLEHESLLIIGSKRTRISTLADLQGKKVTVIGRDGRNEIFLRRLLEQYKVDAGRIEMRTQAPGPGMDKLLATPTHLIVLIYPSSRLGSSADFDGLAHSLHGFTVHALGDAKALQRKVPGLYAETIEAGLLSGSPRIPEEDIETVALQKLLLVRRGLADQHVVELMRALFENGRQLAVENSFATRIEPPDTEKGALIAAHDGASQYVDSEVKTFFDRYSDLLYIGISSASVLGSLAAALYGTVFRHRPETASHRTAEVMALSRRIKTAASIAELAAIESDLEEVLEQVLLGLADGSVSATGLEAFRLAHDHARKRLGARAAGLSADDGSSAIG